MQTIFKFLLIFSTAFFFSNTLWSQDDLPDEQVEVKQNFEARLLDAEILTIRPRLPEVDTITKRQEYIIPNRSIQVDYLPPVIRPLAMKRERPDEFYNGFAKLGAGFPNSFYGEAGYNILKDKLFDFSAHVRHHSANNKKIENQRFSENSGKIKGTYYFDQGFAVNGRIGYSRDYLHYYGYTQDELYENRSFLKEDVLQRFSTFDIGASIFNGDQTVGDINYSAGIDIYNLEDNYAARESGLDLKMSLTKWFNEKQPLTILLRTDFNQFRDSARQNLNNFYLQPNFTYHNDYFRVKLGVNLVSHNDEYAFFPQVEATVPILGSRLTAFIGADGSLQKNTLRTMTDYNPWLSTRTNLVLRNSEYFDYYGGVKGSIRGFEYHGQIGLKQVENLVLYAPNYEGIRQTIVPYDFITLTDNADIFYINGSVNVPLFKGLSVLGNVTSNVFTMDKETNAWGHPSLTVNGTVKYITLEDKVTVKASLFIENGIPYPTETGEKERLNGLFDISVGGSYQITKNFGLFLDVYNLSNNKRQRWYNYPTFGLNAIVGVTARF